MTILQKIFIPLLLVGIGLLSFLIIKSGGSIANESTKKEPKPTLAILNSTSNTSSSSSIAASSSEPVIRCTIHAKCGGGELIVKQNACSQMTCCEFAQQKWVLYPDKNACITDQKAGLSDNDLFLKTQESSAAIQKILEETQKILEKQAYSRKLDGVIQGVNSLNNDCMIQAATKNNTCNVQCPKVSQETTADIQVVCMQTCQKNYTEDIATCSK